jgi:predicted amidohydrolase YtcJ
VHAPAARRTRGHAAGVPAQATGRAVLRQGDEQRLRRTAPCTPAQRITIQEAIDAYTINGARYLNRDKESGCIEVGKSADFIVLDRDILKRAESGQGLDIANTKVLETWFRGASVYQRAQ